MTLASDKPPGRNSGPRETQRTVRVGVGGPTGRVSRERSNRSGVGLAHSSRDASAPIKVAGAERGGAYLVHAGKRY